MYNSKKNIHIEYGTESSEVTETSTAHTNNNKDVNNAVDDV